MSSTTRRQFLKKSAALTAVTLLNISNVKGANNKLIAGVMGVGGRGTFLATAFAKRKDVEIAYLSDPDVNRLNAAAKQIESIKNKKPATVGDFRKILDDKTVDILINATPDHWHGLGTILACQAGKDVYVEKPLSHNILEGRKMVEAARKYKRVVQVGTQSRSAPYNIKAKEYIQAEKLGSIYLVKIFNMMSHPFIKPTAVPNPPESLDYELWCGPARVLPYNIARYWLNYREYSCGPIPGDLIHQIDLARMVLADPPSPSSVTQTGAIYHLKDGRDTPDTQIASFDYGKFTLSFEATLWTPYMKKTPYDLRDTDLIPDWRFNGTRIEIYGTQAFMYLGRHGDGWQVFDESSKLIETIPGRQGDKEHIDNFIQCVRNRALPNSDVLQGHLSTLLCHLANISYYTGNKKLIFDPDSESFPNNSEANALLKRAVYRKGWELPDRI